MALRLLLGLAAAALPVVAAAPSPVDGPVPLAPHQAVYELTLASQSEGFAGAKGRIAMVLKTETCGMYNLDYRFVARFEQDQEITLTDQQTVSSENAAGTKFAFSTKTFVDGTPEKEIRGEAEHEGDATRVSMEAPEERSFALPLSRFPMQHTRELIAKAKAGERIVEARLFDGDDEAEKLLTTTSIISANDRPRSAARPQGSAADGTGAAAVGTPLAGLRSWRISESYYNSDSDPDGLPVFQTSYILYENGVSDDLKLDFGSYVLTGSLSKLDLYDPSACR